MTEHTKPAPSSRYLLTLTLGALGVVFGDIGTSPLYTLREAFHGPHALPLTTVNIFGILSLVVWALIVTVSLKYLVFVLRCDNRGEGGVLALMALAHPSTRQTSSGKGRIIVLMGLFGAALLYGDGIITPAITVLGAIEGLEVATPVFSPYVLPLAIVIICAIFFAQSRGTARIGAVFGPIILVWFVTIALLGISGIIRHPGVLGAINPIHAFHFMKENGWHGFAALGIVFLAVTGGEALYADMGHFGRRPIRIGWYTIVLPALILNYLGQGALVLDEPEAALNPFYRLAPEWALYPLVGLATAAAVIASQALISGAYSLTRQAVSLGYLPRMTVMHTSKDEIGQIYVPLVNWALLFGTIWLVIFFKSSSALASAYGIAVTTTMVITTLLAFVVTHYEWKWPLALSLSVTIPFLVVDLSFFGASLTKVLHGGWFPITVGAMILTIMTTWRRGRVILADRLRSQALPIADVLRNIQLNPPIRVPGTAVFMNSTLDIAPPALVHNVKHNKVLHDKVILMTVCVREVPHIPRDERFTLTPVTEGIYKMQLFYGFMDSPNVPMVLMRAQIPGLDLETKEITYFMGRETLLATGRPGMAIWRERLFSFMARNAQRATTYFRIPSSQVVEIGIQVEL
jgi:KUP system potassium uptake protein